MTTRTDTSENGTDKAPLETPGFLGVRHAQVLLLFLGQTFAFILRVNMSVGIVAMTDSSSNENFEAFDWDESVRSVILSSFFWGYVVIQLPSGQIAHLWSAQKLFAIGMFICGLVNSLIPIAASYGGWQWVCVCRVLMGLTQGCAIPCLHTILSTWAPPFERARLGTIAYSGGQFGTVVGLLITGVIAASSLGWPGIFYTCGILTVIWSVAYFFLGSDRPAECSWISEKEKHFIENSFGKTKEQKPKVPWLKLATSLPLWALLLDHSAQQWGFWTLLTMIPTYMKGVLSFDIAQNGTLSAMPYLAMWILCYPASWFCDLILKKGVSTGTSRKIVNSVGHWGPALALVVLGAITTTDRTVVVAILIIAVGLNAGTVCGYQLNHMDLSPNFAGTMMSITNCFASLMAILAPLISGVIVTDTTNADQWRIIWFISAGYYFLGNLAFVLFGSGEVQSWNEPKRSNHTEDAWVNEGRTEKEQKKN